VELAEWQATLAINLTGTFLCCKHVLPIMKEQGKGAVVNIASIVGKKTLPLRAVYSASKMAVIGFTRALAADYGPFGVRINSVCPGPVAGERQDRRCATHDRHRRDAGRSHQESSTVTPLRCFIARSHRQCCRFLCSEAAGPDGRVITSAAGGNVLGGLPEVACTGLAFGALTRKGLELLRTSFGSRHAGDAEPQPPALTSRARR
jgi:NAD(P)-dependent dehydrogenase (short-subunit alcohol dehydrogenase family)